ncbi:hypothetical protein [Thiolapillus sp.]|uniref:hypothetical protein n=1 Tax=Thiolapillus sp. TaxID=2017437 RepID=UPI003AF6A63C
MFSPWRKARRENSAASRLLGSTSLRFALHGWQRMEEPLDHSKNCMHFDQEDFSNRSTSPE